MFSTLRHMIGYLLVASLLVSPIGLFFISCAVGCFLGNTYCTRVWLALDILACTTIHGTFRRTISGYTGQRLHLRRYQVQAKIIDWLAIRCGDSPAHCRRAYEWERKSLGDS